MNNNADTDHNVDFSALSKNEFGSFTEGFVCAVCAVHSVPASSCFCFPREHLLAPTLWGSAFAWLFFIMTTEKQLAKPKPKGTLV